MNLDNTPAPCCPLCGSTKSYRLEDGRIKCAQCAHKFTPLHRHTHLSMDTIWLIGQMFWKMKGATQTADELDLNVKTIQRYFYKIREVMASHEQQRAVTHFGTATISANRFIDDGFQAVCGIQSQPVCAIAVHSDAITLLLTDPNHDTQQVFSPESITGWLYSSNRDAIERCVLDKIHVYSNPHYSSEVPRQFWQFAKTRLKQYKGGLRHNFSMFLREMEYRFNARNDPEAAQRCCQLLLDNIIHQEC